MIDSTQNMLLIFVPEITIPAIFQVCLGDVESVMGNFVVGVWADIQGILHFWINCDG